MAVTQNIGIPLNFNEGTLTDLIVKDNKLQLKEIGKTTEGKTAFVPYGAWESLPIKIQDRVTRLSVARDLIVNGTQASIKISTRSSSNGVNWTEYIQNAEDGTIQSPFNIYFMVKIEIFSISSTQSSFVVDGFDDPSFTTNKFVDTNGSSLKLKRDYQYQDTNTLDRVGEDKLVYHRIERSKFKRIDSILMEFKE